MKALARLAPRGIDIYYENVGGAHLEAALASLKLWGRIGRSRIFHNDMKRPDPVQSYLE